jgi:hypothetical protein
LSQEGEVLCHRDLKAAPEPFLRAIAPYREDLVVSVAGRFTWSWLAARCAQEGMPCVLGHALDMTAIPGGKATHETLAAHKMAVRRRGGRRPQASGDPAARRATRDLRRRRVPLMRQRAARLAQIQQTNRPDHRPDRGKTLASQANRAGVAERFLDPAGQKRSEGDLARIATDDRSRTTLAPDLVQTAKTPAAQTFSRVRSRPGLGKLPAPVLR